MNILYHFKKHKWSFASILSQPFDYEDNTLAMEQIVELYKNHPSIDLIIKNMTVYHISFIKRVSVDQIYKVIKSSSYK